MNSADKKGNQNKQQQQRRKSTSSEGPRTGTNSTNSHSPDNKKLPTSQNPAQAQQQTKRLSTSPNSARSSDQKGVVDDALGGHEIKEVISGGTIVETTKNGERRVSNTSPTTQQKQQQRKNSAGQQQQRRLSADNNKGTKPQVSDRRRSSSLKSGDTENRQRPTPISAKGPGNNLNGGGVQGQPRKLSVNPQDRNKVHPYPRPNQNKKISQPKSIKPPPSVSSADAGVQNPETEPVPDDILLFLPPNPKLDLRSKGLGQVVKSGATQTLAPPSTKDNFTEVVPPVPPSPGISHAHLTGTAFTFLEETKELNIFLRDEPLVFETPGMVLSSFDVLNDKGETIFFIAEIKSKCFLCTKWSHFLGIYSVLGELVMSVVKRNKNLCHSRASKYRNTAEMQPYIVADRSLPTEAVIVNPFLDSNVVPPVKDPEAAYHVRLTNGQFVGHFKENKLANENTNPYRYILFDIDFRALYQIREVQPMVKNEIVQGNTFQETIFPYMQIYHNHRPIGKIYSGADLRKFGIGTVADHCYHADFPHDIPPVNKALILGLVAVSHCETYPVEDSVCLNCCIVCSRTKCVIC